MNKNIFLLALLFTASAIFISCDRNDDDDPRNGDDDPTPEIVLTSPDEVTVYADQTTATSAVNFNARGAWTATVSYPPTTATTVRSTTPTWITIDRSSGNAGTHIINITFTEINFSDEDRIAIITIRSGGTEIVITITQRGVDAVYEGVVINGIRWATRNVNTPGTFAAYAHSAGRLFQWGTYNGVVHHWDNTTSGIPTDWNSSSNRVAWTSANDPCPIGWRVPTRAEFDALINAGYEWTPRNGVNGTVFGSGNNTIFLPAAGFRITPGTLYNVGLRGFYWSSSPSTSVTPAAMFLHIQQGWSSVGSSAARAYGFSVRCVAE